MGGVFHHQWNEGCPMGGVFHHQWNEGSTLGWFRLVAHF